MANELRITDVVDAKAIADLKQLNEHLLQTKDNYVAVVESIGKGIGAPVKGFEDLKNKAKGYEEAMKQLGEAQKQIIAIQGQYTKLLDEVNKKVSARVKEELEASKASLNNAKAETEAAKQRKLNAEAAIKEAKLQQQEAKKQAAAQMSVADALNNEAKTIAEAAAQNRVLRQAIRELDVTTEDAVKTFELYAAKINANDELMDKFSDNMTARKRNIGNYASAWNGLGMSVQQLARELPALSMGFNTFFLAISNNLPILADEIKRAKERFKELKEAGEEAEPVWKQLGKSIFSWQTLMLVGITLLSMYGKEIAEWAGNLFKGKKALDAVAESEKALHDARVKGYQDSNKERAELKALYDVSQDVNQSMDDRKAAIDELQRRYPDYLGNISDEDFLSGKAKTAVDNLTASLIAQAQARAVLDKITEISNKRLEVQLKADEQQKIIDENREISKEGTATQKLNISIQQQGTATTAAISGAGKKITEGLTKEAVAFNMATSELKKLNTEIGNYDDQITELTKHLDTSDLTFGSGSGGGISEAFGSQLTGNYADYSYLVHDEETINKMAEEYSKKVNAAIAKNMQLTNETYAWMGVRSQQYMSMELDGLVEQYEKGLIDKEEYEKKKAEITERYAIEQAQMAVDLAKEQLTSGNFTEEERFLLEQEIAKKEIALAEKVRDAKIKATKETTEVIKVSLEDALSYASEALGAIGDLAAAFSERDLQRIEEQEEANEEQYEKDIARIEKLEETGAISKEEAEARKRAAEEQTAAKEKELERKRAEIQERQAKFDKAVSISQTIIATSLAIMKAMPNVVMAAMVGAMGAIQLATIIAQPIPKYAKGTKDHKGGLAIVGDGGKREAVFMDGEMYATPDVPTLVNLPKHAVVMPDLSKITSMDGMHSDLLMLMDRKNRMQGDGVVVNVNNDYKRLEKQMDANSSELRQIKKLLKNQHLATDRAMIYNRL